MTSDEQFGATLPYPDAMESVALTDLIWLAGLEAGRLGDGTACLDDEAIAVLSVAAGDDVSLAAARSHLANCARCRRCLAATLVLLADPAIGTSRNLPRPRHHSLGWTMAGLAAAGLAALFVGRAVLRSPPESPTRDTPGTESLAPRSVAPVGTVRTGTPFAWTSVPDASAYRVTVFDSVGTVLFEQRLGDTVVVLPDSVHLEPGRPYFWQAEARTDWDRWTAAPLVEFRVTGDRIDPPTDTDSTGTTPGGAANGLSRILPPTDPDLDAAIRQGDLDPRTQFREHLATARRDSLVLERLASSYRRATGDDFLRRELDRWWQWSPAERAVKLRADSSRIAGVEAFGRDGPRAAIGTWQAGIDLARAIGDVAGEAALHGNVGAGLSREGDLDGARNALETARRLGEASGDWRVVANALSELAGLEERSGTTDRAAELYAEAITLRGRTADRRGLAGDHNNLALLLWSIGRPDESRRHLEQAQQLNRLLGRAGAEATNLVNLASLATAAGAVARAEDDLNTALGIWRTLGDSAEMSSAYLGLAELAVQQGAYADAVVDLRAALRLLRRTGPLQDELIARQRLATALLGQGELQAAMDAWDEYRNRRGQAALAPEVEAEFDLGDADLAAGFGRPAEAAAAYRRSIAHYEALGRIDGLSMARQGLARLLLARGDVPEAAALLEATHRDQLALGDRRGAALTLLDQGELALGRADHATARRLFGEATAGFEGVGDPVGLAWAQAGLARVEEDEGRPARAERMLQGAIERLKGHEAPDLGWRLSYRLAIVRQAMGDRDRARSELQASLATLAAMGAPLRQPSDRVVVREDAASVYARLTRLELAAGDTAAAFVASEGARAREMAELLALGKVADRRDVGGRLVRREQELRYRLAALERDTTAASRRAVREVRADLADLRTSLRDQAPDYAALRDPTPVSWQAVARQLGPHEGLLAYLVTDSATIAFVVRSHGIAAVTLPVPARTLADRVGFARATLASPSDRRWATPLGELYRMLVEPVSRRGLIQQGDRLVIVPHGVLHYLPFAALMPAAVEGAGGPRFLVQDHVLEFTPSASVWLASGGTSHHQNATGSLALAPVPRRLPASRAELAAVPGGEGGPALRLVGPVASEAMFRREAGSRRILHLATFGHLNRINPLFSYIELGAGDGQDGRLEVREIFGLRLAADLVVLSACQTAIGAGHRAEVPAGDDWVGLSWAFLVAGARHVVGSLWAVEDRSTAELMAGFYRAGGADDPALALAVAQRQVLGQGGAPQPYQWAGFVTVGTGPIDGGAMSGTRAVPSGTPSD